ncbi:MAG: cytochrome P450, partial [Candidatus Binatia bacterium]
MNYNPLLPEVQQNPYPYYAYMREHTPVCEVKDVGMWAVTRYDDVLFVLRNYQLFSSSVLIASLLGEFNPVPEAPSIIALDPPEHGRIRKLVNRAFTPRIVAGMESRVGQIAKQLVAQATAKGEFDFVKEISGPLPVMALADILGVEPELQQNFKRWADDIIVAGSNRVADEEARQRIHQSIAEFRTYLIDAIAQRRKARREDLISNLVEAEEGNQKLTPDEVLC